MKSNFQNWSDVRVFLVVLRTGSTLAASKQLGLAQPTVARRIDALEHALGVSLFERNTRGFQPTSAAEALTETAKAIESAVEAFSDGANRLKVERPRVIRITAVDAAFNSRLSAVLEDFISGYGDVQFEFMPSDDHIDLSAGDVDVAIRLTNTIEDQSLICRKITVITTSLFASSGYAARMALPNSEDELGEHKFVVFNGKSVPHVANNWLLSRIDKSQIAMTCPNVKSMQTAVQMGAGIGLLPTRFQYTTDDVIPCFELPLETATTSWLLANSTAYQRPEVKAFMTFFAPRYSAIFRDKKSV